MGNIWRQPITEPVTVKATLFFTKTLDKKPKLDMGLATRKMKAILHSHEERTSRSMIHELATMDIKSIQLTKSKIIVKILFSPKHTHPNSEYAITEDNIHDHLVSVFDWNDKIEFLKVNKNTTISIQTHNIDIEFLR